MNKQDFRYIYILYVLIFMFIATLLDNKYNFTTDKQNTISYVANISELLGLTIALTEIFVLSNITNKIKNSLNNLQSYSDVTSVSIFLSQTKDDLVNKNYGKAIIRLESIRNVYQENLQNNELRDITSTHRTNFDKLNSIITNLTMIENSRSKISNSDLTEFISFITSFNETLISLKLTFKNLIV